MALGETFRDNGEGAIEAGAIIFPGNCGAEFDELALGKVVPQRTVEFVGDRGGRMSHVARETKDEFFAFVKVRAAVESGEVVKLSFSDALFSADGRMHVDSKRTSHHHGDLALGEFF